MKRAAVLTARLCRYWIPGAVSPGSDRAAEAGIIRCCIFTHAAVFSWRHVQASGCAQGPGTGSTPTRDSPVSATKGCNRSPRADPGQARAAVRAGDTLLVPKLDRLAHSVPDARHIGDSPEARGARLPLGGHCLRPAAPLASFAGFEVDLLRLRTREGLAVARARASEYTIPQPHGSLPCGPAPTIYRTRKRTRRADASR
jgi:hypothetical protein